MNSLPLAALSLSLFAGTLAASTTVPPVDAIADPLAADSLTISCSRPKISDRDVTTVLGPSTIAQTGALRAGLKSAIVEACELQVASIVVTRQGTRVDWAPNRSDSNAVAISLR